MGSPTVEEIEDELDNVLELAFTEVVEDDNEGEEEVEEEEEDGEEDDNEVEEGEVEAVQRAEASSLVSMESQGSGMESFQDFGSLASSYEALAEKKRRALSDPKGEGFTKKARLEETSGATFEEMMALTYGFTRRKSRKRKKNGRRKGSRNKLSSEITSMLGDATVHFAHGQYKEAIPLLMKVIKLAPKVADSYHTLGLIYNALGLSNKAMGFYAIAARLKPNPHLWKVLFSYHRDRGPLYLSHAMTYLSKAIQADPSDISLRSDQALLYIKIGDYEKAAGTYEQILQICPDDVEVLKKTVELYCICGETKRSVTILEGYLKDHPSETDFGVIDMLAAILMEIEDHDSALKHIENAQQVYYLGKELPLPLKIKAGICHAHLGDIDKAEFLFRSLEKENVAACMELITEVADAFKSLRQFHSALKYYHMLDAEGEHDKEGSIHYKIAQCHLSLNSTVEAVAYLYKALPKLSDSVDARLTLASLLLEDAKEEEAISVLSPPENSSEANVDPTKPKPWWLDIKIKMKLCYIYRAKGKLEAFANTLLPLVRESLYVLAFPQKRKKHLTRSILRQRIKVLDIGETSDIFGGVRPLAPRSDLLKAKRASRLLKKLEKLKAEERASGFDWNSEDSDDESMKQEKGAPPLPNLLEDDHDLIIDLCKALQSLQMYWEALEIISLTRKLAANKLPAAKDEELQSLAAQISFRTTDPKHSFNLVRSVVQKRPYSFAAWNCFYRITSRLGYSRHSKFLRYMRSKHKDCVPPIVISGHLFTGVSHHQDAAREYLEAVKLLPENPLVNLCAGSALINLSLGFRLQNKHQCVVQGLAFLHNNLRLTENSQEALYNIARAYQQVGMVTLAVSYYERVLSMSVKDYPVPRLLNENDDVSDEVGPGYCDLRREAAYNLHMIYMRSGAVDLARQVLKKHCIL